MTDEPGRNRPSETELTPPPSAPVTREEQLKRDRPDGDAAACPSRLWAIFNEAQKLGEMGRHEDAIVQYDIISKLFLLDSELESNAIVACALYEKGVTLQRLRKREAAIAVFDEVISRFEIIANDWIRAVVANAIYEKANTVAVLERPEQAINVSEHDREPDVTRLFASGPLLEVLEPSAASTDKLRSNLRLVSESEVVGFVVDTEDLRRRFVVECCLDGYPFAIARADLHETEADGFADGCYGFAFAIPEAIGAARILSARVANHDLPVGKPIDLATARPSEIGRSKRSEVGWIGGLRLRGCIEPGTTDRQQTLRAFVDGQCVAQAAANKRTHPDEIPNVAAVLSFDIDLPPQFADGLVHRAHVLDDAGRELPGSPCVFVAFEDGLARFLERLGPVPAETLRAELYDRLVPQSIPFDEFDRWKARFPSPSLEKTCDSVAVVLLGEENIEASLASLEAQEGCDWVAGSFTADAGSMAFPRDELTRFLVDEAKGCAYIAFARSGTIFDPRALNLLANALASSPLSSSVYCDVAVRSTAGTSWPIAFTASDYERTLEQGYASLFFVARRSYVSGAIEGGAHDLYRIFNFQFDRTRCAKDSDRSSGLPVHLPGFLATIAAPALLVNASLLAQAARDHCEAVGMPVSINVISTGLFPAVHIRRTGEAPTLTIVVPTHGVQPERLDIFLAGLLKSIQSHDSEILIVGNGESPFGQEGPPSRVHYMRIDGPYSFFRCANAAAPAASSELLLFLDVNIDVADDDWLDEMSSRMFDDDVGAVAPTIVGPDGLTLGGGNVLGVNFSVAAAFKDRSRDDNGYGGLLSVAHECSAIGVIGMLTRRDLFRKLNGFDINRFPRLYAATDYCLRLRADGHRIVVAPSAKMTDRSAAAREERIVFFNGKHPVRELATLRSVWGHVLIDDPYYNPGLSLDSTPYSALAWPPRPCAARLPVGAPPREIPPGF